MNLNDTYKQLTNIDIEEQKKLWDERGKGYYGEYLVFCELYKNIEGNCKILMNLNIPVDNGKTTEIDLVLIHETGIYVLEIKHYKGTIYGNDTDNIWTQYFRTVKNNTFKNPIVQNAYHINALKNIFNDVPLKSIIVFTNRDCSIKVTNHNYDTDICTMYDLNTTLNNTFRNSETKYSIEEIDSMFNDLSKYSQMKETVAYDGKEESFISWLHPIILSLEEEKNNLNVQICNSKRNIFIVIIINAIILMISIFVMIDCVNSIESNYDDKLKASKESYNSELRTAKQNYNSELKKFKQNFKHINEIDNEYIKRLNEYFSVSNVSLVSNPNNSVTFTAKISRANDTYGMALTENSKYIVMTSNGKVYEYNVFGKHLKYDRYSNMLGKGIHDFGNLARIQFSNVSKDEITYIKITNLELFKLNTAKTLVEADLELELYSK